MKTMLVLPLSALLAGALAGCAAQDTQVARADCKIAPITTKSVVNKPGPMTELDRKWAEAQLRSTDYRRQQLQRTGDTGAIESALNDCN